MKTIIPKTARRAKKIGGFKIAMMPHGCTGYYYSGAGNGAPPPPRDIVKGHSVGSANRHAKFLMSAEPPAGHVGYAVTLTVRDIPETGLIFQGLLLRFLHRMRRMGLSAFCWNKEWQRRGAPHVHGALYFPAGDAGYPLVIRRHWVDCAAAYNPALVRQTCKKIYGLAGFQEYGAKHFSRGVWHYQRDKKNIPAGWRGKSIGRVWGYGGDWKLSRDELDADSVWFCWRRVVRLYKIADAREKMLRAAAGIVRSCSSPDAGDDYADNRNRGYVVRGGHGFSPAEIDDMPAVFQCIFKQTEKQYAREQLKLRADWLRAKRDLSYYRRMLQVAVKSSASLVKKIYAGKVRPVRFWCSPPVQKSLFDCAKGVAANKQRTNAPEQ